MTFFVGFGFRIRDGVFFGTRLSQSHEYQNDLTAEFVLGRVEMAINVDLISLFKTDQPHRDAFLSRVFGIFNEDIVRIWSRNQKSPYEDIGRPTVYTDPTKRGSTLDFCFVHKSSAKKYVVEMKCELQYENYRYLTLDNAQQLKHHDKRAFRDFLRASKRPHQASVKVHGKPVVIDGGILVWGRISEAGRACVIDKHGLIDVLSLEAILDDLIEWRSEEFFDYVNSRSEWCKCLFNTLRGAD